MGFLGNNVVKFINRNRILEFMSTVENPENVPEEISDLAKKYIGRSKAEIFAGDSDDGSVHMEFSVPLIVSAGYDKESGPMTFFDGSYKTGHISIGVGRGSSDDAVKVLLYDGWDKVTDLVDAFRKNYSTDNPEEDLPEGKNIPTRDRRNTIRHIIEVPSDGLDKLADAAYKTISDKSDPIRFIYQNRDAGFMRSYG